MIICRNLRFVKRMGRVLDAHGRSARTVPMDIWSDPAVHTALAPLTAPGPEEPREQYR